MGVVSNKINIMEIMKSGGGGDPTIPGRVTALEQEDLVLAEGLQKVMTSVAALDLESVALAEGLQHVMTSVSSVDAQINTPTTGLEDRVEVLEAGAGIGLEGYTYIETISKNFDYGTNDKTLAACAAALKTAFLTFIGELDDDKLYVPHAEISLRNFKIDNTGYIMAIPRLISSSNVLYKGMTSTAALAVISKCVAIAAKSGSPTTYKFVDFSCNIRSVDTPSITISVSDDFSNWTNISSSAETNMVAFSINFDVYKKIPSA